MKTLTTAIIKGGAGKSTSAAALAQAAAHEGKKVICIDLDPQANLSSFLGADFTKGGSLEVLHGGDPAKYTQTTPQGIDALIACPDLAAEKTKTGSAKRLQAALASLKGYDWLIIDTPPFIGELTYNAIIAAQYLLIPMEPDTNNLQGLYHLARLTRDLGATPEMGAILTRYDPRPRLNRYLREQIAIKGEEIGIPLLGAIRTGIAIKEAQAHRVSLYDYAPKSKPAEDYMTLYGKLESELKER